MFRVYIYILLSYVELMWPCIAQFQQRGEKREKPNHKYVFVRYGW